MYLEVAINTLKGQLPSQPDVFTMAGALVSAFSNLSQAAYEEINGSVFFKNLKWGRGGG